MDNKDKIKINKESYWCGYFKAKEDTIKKILKFVDEESEFIPDVLTDKLLDRLVSFIKKI